MYNQGPHRSPPVIQLTSRTLPHRGSGHGRRALTIIEMLISVTLTLLIMLAAVRMFDLMGSKLAEGRATIEMAGQLRAAAHRLQEDLDGITVPTLPWIDPGSAMGYLEVIEGPGSDRDSDANDVEDHLDTNGDGIPDGDTSLGDIDDVLMFTVRSEGEPFVGRVLGTLRPRGDGMVELEPTALDGTVTPQQWDVESQVAEVIWWVQYDDINGNGLRDLSEPYMLYRRLLLVRPDIDLSQIPVNSRDDITAFLNGNDLSVRPNSEGPGMIANSLSDLSKRENRYAHRWGDPSNPGQSFPYPLDRRLLQPKLDLYLGEDVALSDVLSFDVRVYDPQAPIDVRGPVALVPGDPGYALMSTSPARGAYVDLNYAKDGSTPLVGSFFSGPPDPRSGLGTLGNLVTGSVYDTWPSHYERNQVNEDRDNLIDEGINGLDDDNVNGVDDVDERETAAPYGVPLRGLQVTIRMMDFNTRHVRQVSVVGDFVPE